MTFNKKQSHLKIQSIVLVMLFSLGITTAYSNEANRIQPYSENPYYWQYEGEPVLLLGGTDQDNPFNHPESLEPDGVESHLDLLVSVGGNYLRNTMSHRDPPNAFPFARVDDERFDLTQWNEEYWQRFDDFLRMTEQRDIIVQIEVWETWDYYANHEPQGGWSRHPFNPKNNINYTVEEAKLPNEINFNPSENPTAHNFFHTVPKLENNKIVLSYQQAFVDKMLEFSLNYDHVLYCMNNETGEPPAWGEYWVKYITAKAKETGKSIEITDMRRSEVLSSPDHRLIQDKPDLYTFIEVSQNNGWSRGGQSHWDPLIKVREYIADAPRPINNVKIYGGEDGWRGVDEGVQRFWRNIFAGCASARFHRRFPAAGIGLNELAQSNLRSARMLTSEIDVFASEPHNDLLSDREPNEAYCFANVGKSYALYFPDGGAINLDLSDSEGEWTLRWLNIFESEWGSEENVQGGGPVKITAPGKGHWAALISLTN